LLIHERFRSPRANRPFALVSALHAYWDTHD
jgi:hypothetical protein